MMIEFIGCTGAGKTTLISDVQRRLVQIASVTTSFRLVASPLGLRNVTNPTARHLIQEFIGFPFFIRSLYRHKAFIIFILRMLARQAGFSVFMMNNLRSLVRKISVYEMTKRRQHNQIVLVDEGTVLLAHNIFVYSSALYTAEEIARFASLVPLPDIIIYIKAPVETLVQRSLLRADPPRELKSRNRELIEKQINRAVRMFDQLVEAENIQSRLLIVENSGLSEQQYDTVVNDIAELIMDHSRVVKDV
ncbi:MAG TPA: hypothetical protein VK566_00630 [Nitrososphaeraceae archaeon]|nr:hypothetical protein [Nitrososphaeraceae archaeon]